MIILYKNTIKKNFAHGKVKKLKIIIKRASSVPRASDDDDDGVLWCVLLLLCLPISLLYFFQVNSIKLVNHLKAYIA